MKTIKLLFATSLLFALTSNAQITKGNWMVGGDISLAFVKSSDESNATIINLSPNVGYFILDKFAFGTILNYNYSKSKSDYGTGIMKSTNLGPFLRYYILNKEKNTNLFLETSYNFSLNKDNKNTFFSTKLGAVIFLNSSVGFEMSLKYSLNKFKYSNDFLPSSSSNNFIFGLGFQIHLEK